MILDAEADTTVVGDAGDGQQALAQVERLGPDVVLLDIRMPRRDGLEAARRLCSGGSGTKVVMLTTFDLDEHVYAAGTRRGSTSTWLLHRQP